MPLNLGDGFPDFDVDTTLGRISFHKYLGTRWVNDARLRVNVVSPCSWGVLFSHPADFTPVCTTELGAVAKLIPEFKKRNVVVAALSCNSVESHKNWIKDIQVWPLGMWDDQNSLMIFISVVLPLQSYSGLSDFPYPIISDPNRELAVQLGMLDPVEKDKAGLPLTCRAVCCEASLLQSCLSGYM